MLVGLVIGWLRAMAITEEEKQLREAVRASLLTAASERRSTAGALVPSGATCSSWQTLWPNRSQRRSSAAGKRKGGLWSLESQESRL